MNPKRYTIMESGECLPAIPHEGIWYYRLGPRYMIPTGTRWTAVGQDRYARLGGFAPSSRQREESHIERFLGLALMIYPLPVMRAYASVQALLRTPEPSNPIWNLHLILDPLIWVSGAFACWSTTCLIFQWIDQLEHRGKRNRS